MLGSAAYFQQGGQVYPRLQGESRAGTWVKAVGETEALQRTGPRIVTRRETAQSGGRCPLPLRSRTIGSPTSFLGRRVVADHDEPQIARRDAHPVIAPQRAEAANRSRQDLGRDVLKRAEEEVVVRRRTRTDIPSQMQRGAGTGQPRGLHPRSERAVGNRRRRRPRRADDVRKGEAQRPVAELSNVLGGAVDRLEPPVSQRP